MIPRSRLAILLSIAAPFAGAAVHAAEFSEYSGAQLYNRFCASCHGVRGLGDGPVASSLAVMVPNLTRIAKRQGGVFPEEQIRSIIDGRATRPPHGTREMPVWGYEFSAVNAEDPQAQVRADELINRLLEYVRSLQTE